MYFKLEAFSSTASTPNTGCPPVLQSDFPGHFQDKINKFQDIERSEVYSSKAECLKVWGHCKPPGGVNGCSPWNILDLGPFQTARNRIFSTYKLIIIRPECLQNTLISQIFNDILHHGWRNFWNLMTWMLPKRFNITLFQWHSSSWLKKILKFDELNAPKTL